MDHGMKCRICRSESEYAFKATVLNKYPVSYYHCSKCGFLQTEDPFWLKEAYKESINVSDTGLLTRNIELSKVTASIIYFIFQKDAKFIDYAGGFGAFTRLMRDIGFDYYWHDPFTKNLLAKGFEFYEGFGECELLTSFESFEHFEDPIIEIAKMTALSKNILFSTYVPPTPVPPLDWWYYGFNHGQHLSFYSRACLTFLAKKNDLYYSSYGRLHLFSKRKINESLFRWLVRLHESGIYGYVRSRMKSKTWSDSQIIARRGQS
jgi:hypothetical protein